MWQHDQCISDEKVLLAALLSCEISSSQAIALILVANYHEYIHSYNNS